jgi:hypothetical protein
MPAFNGHLITLDTTVTVWGVAIIITGKVEILQIRKEIKTDGA